MAGANYRIELDDSTLRSTLNGMLNNAGNLAPALKNIGEHLLISTAERFDRRQSPDGEQWDPVSERYAQRKRRGQAAPRGRGGDRRPERVLELTRDLRSLLRYQVTGNELRFGSDRVHAATHQFGDPSRSIPARPFLGLTPDDERSIREILNSHLSDAMP